VTNIHLPPQDLVGIRFAYSPLVELVISYRCSNMLLTATRFCRLGGAGQRDVQGIEFPYIDAVMTHDYVADFLMLTPLAPIRHLRMNSKDSAQHPKPTFAQM